MVSESAYNVCYLRFDEKGSLSFVHPLCHPSFTKENPIVRLSSPTLITFPYAQISFRPRVFILPLVLFKSLSQSDAWTRSFRHPLLKLMRDNFECLPCLNFLFL